MRTTIFVPWLVRIGWVTVLLGATSAADAQDDSVPPELHGLLSDNAAQRARAAKDLSMRRDKEIDFLIKVLRSSTEIAQAKMLTLFSTATLAIDLLGEYRAVEAIDFLLMNVTLKSEYLRVEYNPYDVYPCARALIKIGVPARHAIWQRVADGPLTDEEIRVLGYILWSTDGQDITTIILKHRIMSAKTPAELARLESIMRVVYSFPSDASRKISDLRSSEHSPQAKDNKELLTGGAVTAFSKTDEISGDTAFSGEGRHGGLPREVRTGE